jgi:hypothetical protein
MNICVGVGFNPTDPGRGCYCPVRVNRVSVQGEIINKKFWEELIAYFP